MLVNTQGAALQTLRLPERQAGGQTRGGAFSFATMALEAAGPHTLTAEWQESRAGLALGALRSPACSIAVAAGPPAEVEVRTSAVILLIFFCRF